MRLADIAQTTVRLGGWRRRAVAVLAGAASVLAMAPFHVWPVLALTLPVLVWLIDGALAAAGDQRRGVWRAAGAAWWFGFGYFFAGLFWIGEAFLVEAEKFAFLIPLAVTLMPAGLALFWAAAAGLAALVWRPDLSRVLALALALAAAEWLRGHILTGFPWNSLGYALTHPLALMQSAAFLGIWALGLVAVLVLAMPLTAWADPGLSRRTRAAATALPVLTLAMLWAGGQLRLAGTPPAPIEGLTARLVQPSIPQREKWRPEFRRRNFDQHIALSTRAPTGHADGATRMALVVWPEAAMAFLPLDEPVALAEIGTAFPAGTTLVAGGLRVERPAGPGRLRVFNSLIAFERGEPVAVYDKIHLVPFGEYLPLEALLNAIGLEPLTRMRGGFDTGPSPRPLMRLGRLPLLAPLICYEAIFPRAIVHGAERPLLLLNVTNDGWFGNTTGPRQHLHQARVRAVEEGLPMLRVANNGISAVIDADGRILQRLELDEVGVIDTLLPGARAGTLYSRWGDLFFLVMMLAGASLLALRLRRRGAD